MRVNERSRIWLDLSSYLDDEMAGPEKAKLEERMKEDQNLRSDLNRLKITHTMLRSLPRRKVPHNFTLTPEMVKSTRPVIWAPVFGYTSIATALVAIVLLLVQFLPGSLLNKPSLQAAMPAAEMAMESTTAQDQAAGPEIIYWGGIPPMGGPVAAEGKGGGDSTSLMAPYTAPPAATFGQPAFQEAPVEQGALPTAVSENAPAPGAMEMQPTAQSVAEAVAATEAAASTDQTGTSELTREAGTPTEETLSAETEKSSAESQETGPILGIRPTDEENAITIPSNEQPAPAVTGLPAFVSYIFLGLAATTGMIAYLLRRRH